MEASTPFFLRAELKGHEEDVRAVVASGNDIATGSRDKTVRLWSERDGQYTNETVLVGHTDFVTSLATFPELKPAAPPPGSLVSGSRDLSTIVWSPADGTPQYRLTGHKYQISCVAVGKHSEVISASHDGTIRVYSGADYGSVAVLSGHTGPVQTVLVLPGGQILSGGGDTTIKLWAEGECRATFTGHTDTVRGLALLRDQGVVSASHDLTLKVWDFEGRILADLLGHTAIIYNAATSSSGLIASASEDNTARVWNPNGACLAVVPHPGCVWDVAFLPSGDLVTGCSDYAARIWTASEQRAAPADIRTAYEASLAEAAPQEASSSGAGQLPDGLKLEDASVLLQPGSKDGQIKVVREDGGGMAYSWDAAKGQWERVGQVVGGPESGDMQVGTSSVNGQQYDHVISVEVDDRGQPLRLGVNRGDNPYTVADRFIEEHELPVSYREQIVQYILQNTAAKAGPDVAVNVDPFTGGSAYTPGSGDYTRQPGGQTNASVTGGGVDPFTGSSSRQPTKGRHVPAPTMLLFDALPNPAGVAAKVRSLSSKLAEAPDYGSLLLSDQEAATGGILDRLLSSAAASSSGGGDLGSAELDLLTKLLRWPAFVLYPALDIARMAVLHEPTAARLAESAGPLQLSPLGDLGSALATACAEPQLAPNQQTGLRLACNLFKSPSLRPWLRQQAGALLDGFSPAFSATNKSARSAAAAFLLNLAIMLVSEPLGGDVVAQLVSAVAGLLAAAPQDDHDSQYRGIVALGTLLSAPDREAARIADALQCRALLDRLRGSPDTRVKEAAEEAARLL